MAILSDEFYYQHINLDTVNTQVFTNLTSKVGDTNGRGLIVTLTENGLQKDTTGISLNLKWKHRSGVSQGLDNFDVVDLSKGVYKITYPTEMNRSGLVDAFVQIVDGGKVVGTRNMIISVESTVGDDSAIESSNSFSALASALIEVQSWNDRIDVVEQEFIDKSNNLDATYPTRLVSVETQLAEKATKNATFANASDKLNIFNYLGNVENIHPKVLYFPDKWNGWKYWIAYTPYPGGQTMYENPCLSCSNDGINWVDPSPTINPLYQVPADGYNSDTHIVYNGAELEVWWRTFSTDNSSKYYRRKSSDGLIWQVAEEMFSSVTYGKDMISPAIIFEDGKYKLWAISGAQIKYNESTNGKNWNILDEKTCVTN